MNKPRLRRVIFQEYDSAALIAAREAKGLTLRAAATELGVSYVHLCNVENGTLNPTDEFIEKLCRYYSLDPAKVIGKVVESGQICASELP